MSFRVREHPFVFYTTFVLPAVLLLIGIVTGINVLFLLLCAVWFGVAFMILYLPVETDNGQA